MATPRSKIFYVASAFVVGVAVFIGVFLFATGQFSSAKPIGGPFKLIADNGKPVSDATFKGKPYLIYFGYTHCPDVCPTTLFELSEVMKALGKDADRTAVLFVTIDPERDTAAVMKDYLSNFARTSWVPPATQRRFRRWRKSSTFSPRRCRRKTAITA